MRKEPILADRYRKDSVEEDFLRRLNDILAPHQEADYKELPEIYPTLHVIGAPRSGTTLLTQLVCSHLEVGCVNNLIAAFWRAPVYGVRLSQKLIARQPPSSFQSDCGRTSGLHEPHEFGYFWTDLLGYKEMLEDGERDASIDWKRVRRVLINMTHAFGRPAAFKSFLLGWHIGSIQKALPRTCFVFIQRDPLQNAISILKMRRRYVGSPHRWAGLKPSQYAWLKDEPYWKQVAGQVFFVNQSFQREMGKASRRVLQVGYDRVCADPRSVLQDIRSLLREAGSEVGLTGDPPAAFVENVVSDLDSRDHQRIQEAIKEFYGS